MKRPTRLAQLRAKRDEIADKIVELSDRTDLTRGEEEHWHRLVRQHEKITADLVGLEERAERVAELQAKMDSGTVRVHRGTPDAIDRTLDPIQGVALRALDRHLDAFDAGAAEAAERLIRRDSQFALEFEIHARSEYASAFQKVMTYGPQASFALDDQERAALADSFAVRAQAEGATTTGGFAVPVFIDPTVILADQESDNPFLRLARHEDIMTNAWKGVSAAGVSWSFDDEAEEVSDDSIEIAQPSVEVHSARGFIPYSLEIGQDWPGFQAEMARLLAEGYNELLIDKFTSGSGNGEPRGIITALDANTNSEVIVTTDGLFGYPDLEKVWTALPSKFRRRATWMSSTSVNLKVRSFGSDPNFFAQSVTLPTETVSQMFGRPAVLNDYFGDFTGTTGAANILVVGDFMNYVIARRSGMVVELVPHLFGSEGRPTGQRGFFAWARIGANSVLDNAFRLLQNT